MLCVAHVSRTCTYIYIPQRDRAVASSAKGRGVAEPAWGILGRTRVHDARAASHSGQKPRWTFVRAGRDAAGSGLRALRWHGSPRCLTRRPPLRSNTCTIYACWLSAITSGSLAITLTQARGSTQLLESLGLELLEVCQLRAATSAKANVTTGNCGLSASSFL